MRIISELRLRLILIIIRIRKRCWIDEFVKSRIIGLVKISSEMFGVKLGMQRTVRVVMFDQLRISHNFIDSIENILKSELRSLRTRGAEQPTNAENCENSQYLSATTG